MLFYVSFILASKATSFQCLYSFIVVCGELDVLDILYTAGADLNTSDIHGAYPIHYAAQMCSTNSEMGVDSRIGLTGNVTLISLSLFTILTLYLYI